MLKFRRYTRNGIVKFKCEVQIGTAWIPFKVEDDTLYPPAAMGIFSAHCLKYVSGASGNIVRVALTELGKLAYEDFKSSDEDERIIEE